MIVSLLFTGPVGALYTCAIGCSIIFFRGNVPGGLLKLIAELATILAFAAIHKGIIPKSIAAVTSRVFVTTLANFCLLPLFYVWASQEYLVSIIFPIGIFNVTQALINIVPTYLIYHRLRDKWELWRTSDTVNDSVSVDN